MNERMIQYWNTIKQYWNKLNRTYKLLFIGTIILSVLTVGIVIYNNSKIEYALAFTDLQPADAAAIKNYLESAGIPYQLSADGKSIGVPRNMATNVKLDVESQGLNRSGSIGYGSFRESNWLGTTDNQFEMLKLDAIQGEIEQLLNSISAISWSKVVITLPESGAFIRTDRQQATASVVVDIKPGYVLDQNKINTMYSLVSKSVPNLPIENIQISDQNGDLLPYVSDTNSLTASNVISQQFEIKKQFEEDLRKAVKEYLGGILGYDRVVPMVVATLNFDKKSKESNLVTPVVDDSGLPISMQETLYSATNADNAQGGIAGTGTTDIPTYPGEAGAGGRSNVEESSTIINYEINRIHEIVESAPYHVTDLTISVGIDGGEQVSQQTKDNIQKMLEAIVATSLANSGKTLTAEELSSKVTVFDQAFIRDVPAPGAEERTTNWLLYGGIAAGVLAALAAAGGLFMASRRKNRMDEAMVEDESLMLEPEQEVPFLNIDNMTNENQARKQLEQLAKEKPDEFVNLLRTWLVDE